MVSQCEGVSYFAILTASKMNPSESGDSLPVSQNAFEQMNKRCLWGASRMGKQVKRANWVSFKNLL